MPTPFVYLIPEDYFGPVVTLFGQPDGVEMKRDPLGHSVEVPPTGVIKVRPAREDVMGISKEGAQATYFISTGTDGSRRSMKILTDAYRENGAWWQGIIDERMELHRYEIGDEATGNFDHIPIHLQAEKMILARRGCRFRFIHADPISKQAGCDEFLVISPNEELKVGEWIWGGFGDYFDSTESFIRQVDDIQKKKIEYVNNSGA